jgi:uncharacterized protein
MKINNKKVTAIAALTLISVFLIAIVISAAAPAFAAGKQYVFASSDQYFTEESMAALDAQAQSVYDRFGIECYFDISEVSLEETDGYAKSVFASRGGSDPGMIMVVTADHVITWVSQTIAPEFTDEDMEALHNAYDKPETYYDAVAAVFSEFERILTERGFARTGSSAAPETRLIPEDRQRPLLVDDAGILSNTERTEVEARLNELSRKHSFDIAVVTVDSHDYYGVTDYADDFYDYNGYGQGDDNSGIMFLIAMDTREWHITTTGKGIPYFTDAGQEYIMDKVVPYLSSGNYGGAFLEFANICDEFLAQAETGDPYDIHNLPRPTLSWKYLPVCLLIGFLPSFGITKGMKNQLKTRRFQSRANQYQRKDSFNLYNANDTFLYRRVTHVPRVESSSSGSSRGGSSTHTSSSGTSHGGSSGRF